MNDQLLIRVVHDPIFLNIGPHVELRLYSEIDMQGRIGNFDSQQEIARDRNCGVLPNRSRRHYQVGVRPAVLVVTSARSVRDSERTYSEPTTCRTHS